MVRAAGWHFTDIPFTTVDRNGGPFPPEPSLWHDGKKMIRNTMIGMSAWGRITALCVLSGFASASPQNSGKAPFSITISTTEPVFKVGSEIRIKLVFKNTSDGDVPYSRGPGVGVEPHGELFSTIEVRGAKGELVSETEYRRILTGRPGPSPRPATSAPPKPRPRISMSVIGYWLKPGEAREEDIDVSQLYDLSQPGQYTISAFRRLSDVDTDPRSKIIAFSNTLTITVTK